ncbi:MAG: phosphate/phosphite/phosphonate ABC transporter substrate-binding protein, partial [Chloroflexi bacterium]|nr:phosphate/phosphite/phosphonate ABC transporter substrate-binding protein [Chloroflexota bacterium]
ETAACLNKITGLTFQINVQTSYAGAIEALGANKANFSFLATFAAILAKQKYGVEPVLVATRAYQTVDLDPDKALKGQQQPYYKGQFITKKGSPIKTLADLKGKTFCFTDPLSTSGTIIPQVILKANGINPDKDLKASQFAGSHPNVVSAVYKGDCDAGATFIDARTDASVLKTYPDVNDKVDIFYVTDKIPNDGMQVSKDTPAAIRDATVNGLLGMMADPGGKAVVRRAYTYDNLVKVPTTHYDEFAELLKKAGVDPASLFK